MIGSVNGNAYNVYANPMFTARVPAKDNVMSFETVSKSAEQAKTESAEQAEVARSASVSTVDLSTLTGETLAAYNVIKGLDSIFRDLSKSGLTPEQMQESASAAIKKLLESEPLCKDNGSNDYCFYFSVGNAKFSIEVADGFKLGSLDEKEADAFYSRIFGELENAPGGKLTVDATNVGRVAGRKSGMIFSVSGASKENYKSYDREFYVENGLADADEQGVKDFLLSKHGSPTNNMTKKEFENFVWDVIRAGALPKGGPMVAINHLTGEINVGGNRSQISEDEARKSTLNGAMARAAATEYFNFAKLFEMESQYMELMASKGLIVASDYKGYRVWADFLANFK